MENKRLMKVIYFSSNDFSLGLRTELDIDQDRLVALEIYDDGTFKYIVIKDGMVNYILKGE